jgi:hypothetical protein
MVHFFDFTKLKERYRLMISDRRVNIHATLGEMLGTGMVVFIGTSAVQFASDALANSASPDIGAHLQPIDGFLFAPPHLCRRNTPSFHGTFVPAEYNY